MFQKTKKTLYFAFAWYFRIFASIKLNRWNPRIIVITGSNGKTTLLHLVESQLGNLAKYSHHANSSIGIPFDILGLKRTELTLDEWPGLILSAPFKAFSKIPDEKIYVVECDCDRPYEGDFLSSLLKPEVTLWTNVGRTHSMNFDNLVKSNRFDSVDKAIAHEFGYFAAKTQKLVMLNSDDLLELSQSERIKCNIKKISTTKSLKKYTVDFKGTEFLLNGDKVRFNYLFPKEISTSILMCKNLIEYLETKFDYNFSNLELPPGRNSFFGGIEGTTIVDSAYNASLSSMEAVLDMFSQIKSEKKWVVLGDMLELGDEEKEEHEKLADVISKYDFQRIILMGPRITKYAYLLLKGKLNKSITLERFLGPKEVLDYLKENIQGNEVILFKGARFLEGVIENLLLDKKDAAKLDRREKIWEIRRKKWGL